MSTRKRGINVCVWMKEDKEWQVKFHQNLGSLFHSKYAVQKITQQQFVEDPWEDETMLLCALEPLEPNLFSKLFQYVKHGGFCFGFSDTCSEFAAFSARQEPPLILHNENVGTSQWKIGALGFGKVIIAPSDHEKASLEDLISASGLEITQKNTTPELSHQWIFVVDAFESLFDKVAKHWQDSKTFKLSASGKQEESNNQKTEILFENKSSAKTFLDIQSYFSHLKTKTLGKHLLCGQIVSSTQTILKDHFVQFRTLGSELVFVAQTQVSGVGRGGNIWVSPAGCLMFSLQICDHKDYSTLIYLQYLMAVAITKSIKQYISTTYSKETESVISIKWPNDIYSFNKKIGGIIISSNYYEGSFTIVIGVGINLDNREPTTCVNEIIRHFNQKYAAKVPSLSPEHCLALILTEFEQIYNKFSQENISDFLDEYYNHWMHSNQKVTLQMEDNSFQTVVIRGVTKSGFLDAVSEDGKQSFELHPNGNSFDMMKNLISKKQ